MARNYQKKRQDTMDVVTRKALATRLMSMIVDQSPGNDDLERRKNAESLLARGTGNLRPKHAGTKDGRPGRPAGTSALDILTGDWVPSEEVIERMRLLAYGGNGVPNDLIELEVVALARSFDPYEKALVDYKAALLKLTQPLLEAAEKTRQPGYARALLADALRSAIPRDTQDHLTMPAYLVASDEPKQAIRFIDMVEEAEAALRPRQRRRRKSGVPSQQ